MRVAVTGSTGLIGSRLVAALVEQGHDVVRIVRRAAGPGEAQWDPERHELDPAVLRGVDAVVNLAGEPVGGRRLVRPWSATEKARIRDSRIGGTSVLAEAIAALGPDGPQVLVNGSAIGFYGDRGEETLDEESAHGSGFLSDLCVAWEAATGMAREAGARVAIVRSGVVLDPKGGALSRQLPLFRLGLGGRLGTGRQWFSWITIDDEVNALVHALTHDDVVGPVNAVAPTPVTNAEFTSTMAGVLRRPALLPVPSFALKLLLGEPAGELLGSQRVVPRKLTETGFTFAFPMLEPALRHVLGRT